ncbi:MAG: iron-only hydrogenase system regulator [Selenomonadales bacterium]|nr:iron-only hydrogenase system regulator [Selenomonadales bacterium]
METRVALLGIIVGSDTAVEKVNQVLHEYRQDVVGRMGLPYPKQNVSIISIVLDAPQSRISALSGKLGMIPQVTAKTIYSKMPNEK